MHVLVERLRDACRRSRLVAFVRAVALPFRAARFLAAHRALWPLVVVPVLINLALFVVAVVLVVAYAGDVVAVLWAPPPGAHGVWTGVLLVFWYVLYAAAVVLGLMAAYVATLLLSGIVSSPFNDVLSARAERLLTGRAAPSPGGSVLREAVQSVVSTATIVLLYTALMVPVLLLNVVPGAGSLAATLLGTVLGAFFLALEFTDVALARRGYPLRRKLRLLRAYPALTVGFGLSTSLLLWIPLLNILGIPIAVVGGTALALALDAEHGAGRKNRGNGESKRRR